MLLTLRDRSALVLMLVAPLALTLVVGFAFGGFGDSQSGVAVIPMGIVNHDSGQFSPFLVEAFQSAELADLVTATVYEDEAAARQMVDDDQLAALVIVPENFSDSIVPAEVMQGGYENQTFEQQQSEIEIYASPASQIGSGIVRSITNTILLEFSKGMSTAQISILSLVSSGAISEEELTELGEEIGRQSVEESVDDHLLSLNALLESSSLEEFSFLDYMAASMAILFMMFSMTSSTRTILVEREEGTLPRMLVSPTKRAGVLGGKMLGAYLNGVLQMLVLILAGRLLFGINWGNPLGVLLVTLTLVGAACGWGLLVASFARSAGQASAIGMAINLTFAALAGNFLPRSAYPLIIQKIGLITPNAWGLESYSQLINGAAFSEVLGSILALLGMTLILFAAAILVFRRQYK